MYQYLTHQKINSILADVPKEEIADWDNFYVRLTANMSSIDQLYSQLYGTHEQSENAFKALILCIAKAAQNRSQNLRSRDKAKAAKGHWFLSNDLVGMSLYVDRFCGNLKNLQEKLPYFEELGVNLLHLMPLFESPENESDGGYAVSDFRKVAPRFGTLTDLQTVQKEMAQKKMYLMLDIVLNHTSHKHEWARLAKQGNKSYQDFYYMFEDRQIPDEFEQTLPEIFPEAAPGNFTYCEEAQKWVMTVFHNYQWDLNYRNPAVLVAMLDTIFFYANLGVDILRIDAPAFIWKELGTNCQNLPKAHSILRLIRQCVAVATPGMALLGEAIVAPKEIMKYFGAESYEAQECDFAYNATQMAVQWDALATGDTRIMQTAQNAVLHKPLGTSWITYTRCHDDIGLGYDDAMIAQAGFTPYFHRKFITEYYAGQFKGSMANGALFGVNPKTQDARISGSLASLCGLEKAVALNDALQIELALKKIMLLQAHSFFTGGVPMLYYGDEVGYFNDMSYLNDAGKAYDNRWMHRPMIDWQKNERRKDVQQLEGKIFANTQKLIQLRKKIKAFADYQNLTWLNTDNKHIIGFYRSLQDENVLVLLNYSPSFTPISLSNMEIGHQKLHDCWEEKEYDLTKNDLLTLSPYQFLVIFPVSKKN